MSGFALPDGWTSEHWTPTSDRFVVIKAPDIGFVTIDFETRSYRAGIVVSGPPVERSKRGVAGYRGRNWRASLILDAVAWLEGVARTATTPKRKAGR